MLNVAMVTLLSKAMSLPISSSAEDQSAEDQSSDGDRAEPEDFTEYPKRDFGPSHVYRIGLHLFKTTEFRCRRRIMVAAPSISSNSSQTTRKEFGCQTMFRYEGIAYSSWLIHGNLREENSLGEI